MLIKNRRLCELSLYHSSRFFISNEGLQTVSNETTDGEQNPKNPLTTEKLIGHLIEDSGAVGPFSDTSNYSRLFNLVTFKPLTVFQTFDI